MRHDPADQVGEDPTAGVDAARAYRDFWTDVGSTFPDLHGARSTAQYLEDEQWLFQTHLAPLEGLRILKTDPAVWQRRDGVGRRVHVRTRGNPR